MDDQHDIAEQLANVSTGLADARARVHIDATERDTIRSASCWASTAPKPA